MRIHLLVFWCLLNVTYGGSHERRLLKDLFVTQEHNPIERPVANEHESVSVDISFSLIRIIDYDVKNRIFTINMWINQKWNDYSMRWQPKDYGNITKIVIPSEKIWIPDIVLQNNIDQNIDEQMKVKVAIDSNGDVMYVTPKILRSSCSFDTSSGLSDIKYCSLNFGSWTFEKSELDLRPSSNETDTSSYQIHNDWTLADTFLEYHETKYDCCPNVYQSVVLVVKIRQQSTHFPMSNNATNTEAD